MSKKSIQMIGIMVLMIGTASCTKETKTEEQVAPAKKVSKMELLCQTWTLDETYENEVKKSSAGTDKYLFTRQGAFKFYYNNAWMDIGTYSFTSKDSNAIAVLFMGTSMPTVMTLDQMDDKVLNTSFVSGGKNLLYKYKR